MTGRVATAEADIDAPRSKVWRALMDPDQIQKYMFGSRAQEEHPDHLVPLGRGGDQRRPGAGLLVPASFEVVETLECLGVAARCRDRKPRHRSLPRGLQEVRGTAALREPMDR